MQGFGITTLKGVFIVALFFWTKASAEEECLRDNAITCFECQSWVDPRCNDPFNSTVFPIDLPNHQDCKGCCVKIVTNLGTDEEKVRRTCTEHLRINLFNVDHVCMYQSDGMGKMCFCETHFCNFGLRISSNMAFFGILASYYIHIFHNE